MRRELLVSRLGGQLWSALLEDGVTVELRVEQGIGAAPVGRIIKARVTNILPGIQSAFLDIGTERGAFLHASDLFLPGEPVPSRGAAASGDPAGEVPAGGGAAPSTARRLPPLEDRLSVGRELLVQVSRERLGSKGARVTGFLSIPGRLLVLLPLVTDRGVSRRIEDPAERERLREILERLPGEGLGFVARTAAAGASEADLRSAAAALIDDWCEIQDRATSLPVPSVIQREPGLLPRLLRETPRDGLERIVVDDESDHAEARDYLVRAEPALAPMVSLHAASAPLFESRGLHTEIEKALRPRVWLKSGGYVVIEQTEALVSIDVNTGKFLGRRDLEQTALRTNIEAAREIGRQLRLRDLGGIIVIDFIDMDQAESRRLTVEELRQTLRADPVRTKIVGLSDLGLLQLTRKRTRPGLGASLTRPCPLCAGQGRIRSARTLAAEILGSLRRAAAEEEAVRFEIRVHPEALSVVTAELMESDFPPDGTGRARVDVEADEELRHDRFELRRRPE